MGRHATVPSGVARLTADERAWIDGDNTRPNRPYVVQPLAYLLSTLYWCHRNDEPEVRERYVRAKLADALAEKMHVAPSSRSALASNAMRIGQANGYVERRWSDDTNAWVYALTADGVRVSEAAWDEGFTRIINERDAQLERIRNGVESSAAEADTTQAQTPKKEDE